MSIRVDPQSSSHIVGVVFVPLAGLGAAGTIIVLASTGVPRWTFVVPVLALLYASFCAEARAPFEPRWNIARNDRARDWIHATVNEALLIGSLLAIGAIGLTNHRPWPVGLPVWLEIVLAILVLDVGITLAHFLSHRIPLLWRFHAVHHSVRRCYSLNGLMKHPVHQLIEASAGVGPLLVLGVPSRVLSAATALVAVQLLLQHSNVAVRLGWFGRWFALAPGHRQHHLSDATAGDVNFGLFLLVWDRALGTYSPPDRVIVRDGQLGIAGWEDFPTAYLEQLRIPFHARPHA